MNTENKEAEIIDNTERPVEGEEKLSAIKAEAELSEYRLDFDRFYSSVKLYKGRELDMWQLKGKGPLPEIMVVWRHILADGGITDEHNFDRLVGALKELAESSETKQEFWRKAFDPKQMVSDSDLYKFFKAFTDGLTKAKEDSKEAA